MGNCQLYVSFSQMGAQENVTVMVANCGNKAGHLAAAGAEGMYAKNGVYPEVLT
jgi:hypothetical protein